MWAGDNVAAEAAHKTESGTWDRRERLFPGIRLPGRRVCGFGIVELHSGDGMGRKRRW